jgi:VWFA-related protein
VRQDSASFRITLAALSLSACALFAQVQKPNTTASTAENQHPLPPTFKSQTTLVEVPAVITDKHGKQIHGLKQEDFQVFENGKEKKIAVFEEVTASNERIPAGNRAANTFSNVTVNAQDRHALTIILLDQINTPFLDQFSGRQQLIKFLAASLDSSQPFGLMILGRNGVQKVTDFTQDPSSLIAAVKKLNNEMPAMQGFSIDAQAMAATQSIDEITTYSLQHDWSPNPGDRLRRFALGADAVNARFRQERALEDTMAAFLSIAWSLSGIPGRKSLVWATGSFPFYMDSPSSKPDNPHLAVLYERAMQALNDAQVSVYPVDVRGLGSNSQGADSGLSSRGLMTEAWSGKSPRSARSNLQVSTIENLKIFAEMTGGRAFYNSNDLTIGFRQAAEDSSSYYVLGYYLDSQNPKPGWRKLHVKLQRSGAEVRAREGFFVGTATKDAESAHKADVNFALSSPFESTGIPVLVRWNSAGAPTGQQGQKAEFAIIVPANSVVNEFDQNQFDIDFVWEADRTGVAPQKDGKTAKGSLDAEGLAKAKKEGVFFRNSLQLPPGEYKVHFVVRNNLNGRIGSVTSPLTVN